MSKARDLADLVASQVITSDTSGVANSLPINNFIYGADEVPANLPDGHVYIKVDTGAS